MRFATLFRAGLAAALLVTATPIFEPGAASAGTAAGAGTSARAATDSSCRYYHRGRYYRYRWHGSYYNWYWHGRYYLSRYRCYRNGLRVWCYR